MSIKKDTLKKIIIGTLGLVALAFSCVILFGGKEKPATDQTDIPVEAASNTYESKLRAYKEKRKKEKEEAYKKGYDPDMDIVQPDPEPTQEEQEDLREPDTGESTRARPSTSPRPAKPAIPTERSESAEAAIMELQKTLEDDKQPEGKTIAPPQPTAQAQARPQSEPDEKERRRKAMQTWNKRDNTTAAGKTYQAVIHKEQVVSNGKMAAFRTKEEISTGSLTIPANTLLYGTVNVGQNRLTINISSVTINRNVYPIKLSVYGTDGAPGIPVQIDNVQKAADARIGDEIVSATKKRTGVIGDVVGGIANAMKREKDISCTLIDNQTIYLKIN